MNVNIYLILILIILSLIYWHRQDIKTNLLTFLIVERGVLSPNCTWWAISEKILTDASGINVYYDLKKKYGSFFKANFGGHSVYVVTNPKYIKMMFENSPDIFGVGKLKYNIFKSFMPKNVGVSEGCPWRIRRLVNENVLFSENLHPYSQMYNQSIRNLLKKNIPTNYSQFSSLSRKIAMKIVFNDDFIREPVFRIFSEANSMQAIWFGSKKINPDIDRYVRNYFIENIRQPTPFSLIELAKQAYNQQLNRLPININHLYIDQVCQQVKNYGNIEDELINQIPHWIFPIVGLVSINIPRLLLLLCNHRQIFDKLILKINQMDNIQSISNLKYLRYCILELLRLNNPVTTTFRTLLADFRIDQHFFKKNDQFVILNNPVLRDPSFFTDPNRYIPERWNQKMEESYYTIMFNQGPQKCPGKEFAILITQLVLVNYLKYSGILRNGSDLITCNQFIDTNNIPQMINPCKLEFTFRQR